MTNTVRNLNSSNTAFTFPDYQALWQFMEKAKAIHIRIEPRRNRVSGQFGEQDIDIAVQQFQAKQVEYNR